MPGPGSGETAKTLVLIGLLLQVVEVVVLFAIGLAFSFVPLLGGLVLLAGVIGLLWVALVYVFSYQRVRDGDYEAAMTPTLVFAILSLLSSAIVSGVLYLVAYLKLGDASREAGVRRAPWGDASRGNAPASGSGRSCALCGEGAAVGATFCAGCGSRLA